MQRVALFALNPIIYTFRSPIRRAMIISLLSFFAIDLIAENSIINTTNQKIKMQKNNANLRTFAEHQKKVDLEYSKSINIGFDFDDTLVYSSDSFTEAKNEVLNNSLIPNGPFIFHYVTQKYDQKKSLAKKIGLKLINYHSKRSDTIYIITARVADRLLPTDLKPTSYFLDQNAKHLAATFNLLFRSVLLKPIEQNQVIFTGRFDHKKNSIVSLPKAHSIKEKNIKLFYGDADSDIEAAIAAKIQPIRILRSKDSSYLKSYQNLGINGEWIIADSDI